MNSTAHASPRSAQAAQTAQTAQAAQAAQAAPPTQRRSRLAVRLAQSALPWCCSLALLSGATTAAAQSAGGLFGIGSAPRQASQTPGGSGTSLVCQPATITVFPSCMAGTFFCGPGDGGPGMSQKSGVPNTGTGVTGSASASSAFTASSRAVEFSYTVPDVRVFAPAAYTNQLMPAKTQTWVVKASEVPGSWGSNITKLHGASDYSTSLTGSTSTAGNTSTTGRWLLLGQVSAQAVVANYFKDVSYGFSCELPVQNLNLQSPIYQAPTTLKP